MTALAMQAILQDAVGAPAADPTHPEYQYLALLGMPFAAT